MSAKAIQSEELTTAQAIEMSMSIRPVSGGLTFVIYGDKDFQSPQKSGFLAFSLDKLNTTEELIELFYQNDFLMLPYHQVRCLYQPISSVLLAKELYQENFSEIWKAYIQTNNEALAVKVETLGYGEQKLLSYLPEEWVQFLDRSFIRVEYQHYMAETIGRALGRSLPEGEELLCTLRCNALDCFLIRKGQIAFSNSYELIETADPETLLGEIVYYLFMLLNQFANVSENLSLSITLSQEEAPKTIALFELLAPKLEKELKGRLENVTINC